MKIIIVMKKSIVQYSLLSLFVLLTAISYGQVFEKSKSLSRSFSIEKSTEIEISNKYGDINIVNWEKDSVKFDVDIKVITNKESKLNSTFDYIDVNFNATKHYVIAETSFEGQGSFWSDVKDLAGTVFNSSTKTSINYTIYLPQTAVLIIENKYGNIYFTDYAGKLNISLSNGDIKAHNLLGYSDMTLRFCNANISTLAKGKVDIGYYSEMHVKYSKDIDIKSRSSKIYVRNYEELKFNSIRDHIYLGKGNIIHGKFDFTHLETDELKTEFNVETKYGEFIVNELGDMKKGINIYAESTQFEFYKTPSRGIKFDITYNENAGLFFDDEIKAKQSKPATDNEKLVVTKGYLSNNSADAVVIKAMLMSADLKIKNN